MKVDGRKLAAAIAKVLLNEELNDDDKEILRSTQQEQVELTGLYQRVNNKKMLHPRFSLANYDYLNNISDVELFDELHARYVFTQKIIEKNNLLKNKFYNQMGKENILSAAIEIMTIRNESIDFFDKVPSSYRSCCSDEVGGMSSSSLGISPLNRVTIDSVINRNFEVGAWKGKTSVESQDIKEISMQENDGDYDSYLHESISLISELRLEGEMWISVNLHKDNDVLISDFANLLDKWRNEMGVEYEPAKIGSWDVTRRKILEYKIIPMIDLQNWASLSGVKITHSAMALTLFPNGECQMDGFKIAQTVKPFIEKIMSKNSIEKIKWEISKEKSH